MSYESFFDSIDKSDCNDDDDDDDDDFEDYCIKRGVDRGGVSVADSTKSLFYNDYDCEPKSSTLNFSSFKTSFTSNVNFLKRRFSSGDLSSEADDVDPSSLPPAARPIQDQPTKPPPSSSSSVVGGSGGGAGGPPSMPPPPAPGAVPPQPTGAAPELSLSFGAAVKAATSAAPPRGVSAPTSPAKSRESLLQRVQSLTGAARDQGASILGAAVQSATRTPAFNKEKFFTLLVLDDQNTDWSKYFRGRRLHGDFDIRVEQAEFRDISLTSSAETGPIISMAVYRGGTRVARSFRPDFVLVRQPPRDGSSDFRSTLLGLKYGGVPSINSLHSIYQFQDKPWVFAHLLQLQRRLGREAFPLIEQTFFPNPRDLFGWARFPCVLKAGHCHGGVATARLDNPGALQDAAGLVTGAGIGSGNGNGCYCVIEPYIDAKFDVQIQKIGNNYKAFMRKSISGNWKTNQGSAMLEQIALTEKYKSWVDEVSELFGGMEVCGLSVVVGKDGREFIISACDCTFALIGDTQEDDRRQIAELVSARMQNVCRPAMAQSGPVRLPSRSSISSRGESPTDDVAPQAPAGPRPAPMGGPPPIPERTSPAVGSIGRLSSRSSVSEVPDEAASKQSDLDIIFGDNSAYAANGKFARSSGSLSDADLIFGGPSSYKTDRFGSSKSMSVTSDRHNSGSGIAPYKIYEGIQNAAFSDYAESPSKQSNSNASINSYSNRWSQPQEEDEELDLK